MGMILTHSRKDEREPMTSSLKSAPQPTFQTIGLIGKPQHQGANETLNALHQYLLQKGYTCWVEERVAADIHHHSVQSCDLVEIGERCDLAIVVGGDGNMLGAARVLARFDIAVIGVNRGNLGFLTDLNPDSFQAQLEQVLAGYYLIEKRFLLEAEVYRHQALKASNSAMNEAVLHPDKIAHMIDFDVYIDGHEVFSQRCDGLIVSTPTGSTAYNLSAGGPILTPNLDALTLVPMFPHTLSARPIVVDGNSDIRLKISNDNKSLLEVSCDSQATISVQPGDDVRIFKSPNRLKLIHPPGYSYFDVLRTKLNWSSKLF